MRLIRQTIGRVTHRGRQNPHNKQHRESHACSPERHKHSDSQYRTIAVPTCRRQTEHTLWGRSVHTVSGNHVNGNDVTVLCTPATDEPAFKKGAIRSAAVSPAFRYITMKHPMTSTKGSWWNAPRCRREECDADRENPGAKSAEIVGGEAFTAGYSAPPAQFSCGTGGGRPPVGLPHPWPGRRRTSATCAQAYAPSTLADVRTVVSVAGNAAPIPASRGDTHAGVDVW